MKSKKEKIAEALALAIERSRGFVYLVYSENGYHKIGITRNVNGRLKEFQSLPISIELIHYFETSNCRAVEGILHDRFSAKRFRGEWFILDGDDVNWFKTLEDYDARFEEALSAGREAAERFRQGGSLSRLSTSASRVRKLWRL